MKPIVGFFALNVIRFLNILSIIACIAASACLLVKTSNLTDNIGWYNIFDLAENCLIIVFALLLLFTELPGGLGESWLIKHWYHLSTSAHRFGVLALCLVFLGCDTLGYLAKKDTDAKHIGADFFRLVQAAGFMALVMAPINFVAGWTFNMKKSRDMTARDIRRFGRQQHIHETNAANGIPMA